MHVNIFFWFHILFLSLIQSIKNVFGSVNIFKLYEFLQKKNPKYTYEIIVVDDGSKDKTTQVKLMHTQCSHSTWKNLNNNTTSGKSWNLMILNQINGKLV